MALNMMQNQRNNQHGLVLERALEMRLGKMIAVNVPGSGSVSLRGGDRDV